MGLCLWSSKARVSYSPFHCCTSHCTIEWRKDFITRIGKAGAAGRRTAWTVKMLKNCVAISIYLCSSSHCNLPGLPGGKAETRFQSVPFHSYPYKFRCWLGYPVAYCEPRSVIQGGRVAGKTTYKNLYPPIHMPCFSNSTHFHAYVRLACSWWSSSDAMITPPSPSLGGCYLPAQAHPTKSSATGPPASLPSHPYPAALTQRFA